MPQRQFEVLSADRLTPLIARLAARLAADPLPPLVEETIVVQSQGMRRWIQLELARRSGCAASLRLPFPASFCRGLADRIDPPPAPDRFTDSSDPFDREVMTWRIMGLLESSLINEAAFAPLRRYCADDVRKRLALASRIARTFDDYVLYRPDLMETWETGGTATDEPQEAWQAELWRRVQPEGGVVHRGRRLAELVRVLESAASAPTEMPARVSVFGVSSLPPVFVNLLYAVSRFVPVTFYVAIDAARSGHPLAEAWGPQARELATLLERDGVVRERLELGAVGAVDRSEANRASSLLTELQRDLVSGRVRRRDEAYVLDLEDRSLQVHVCHSPLREMEVLRDQLLDAFDADPTLRPHEVLVMVPDVSTYHPYIEAVFGAGDQPVLPYHVADRPLVREFSIARHVLDLLMLVDARRTVPEVLALLDAPAVRRRAGIAESDLPALHAWVEATRIRWGTDGAERAELFGLPPIESNTWRAGLDRLLMGYAAGPVEDLVAGVLPHAGHTAGDAVLLGRFAAWIDGLFAALDGFREPRTLAEWRRTLLALLDEGVAAADESEEKALGMVRAQLDTLARMQFRAGYETAVSLSVVRDWLGALLTDDSFGSGFLTGGITFAAVKPMRAIPFKVVAIAGLDDASFPRRQRPPAFDLIARDGRAGDRDLRSDDRQLFLDTLLAAERRVILSYVGRSAQDNSVRAASVVIAELLDHLDQMCTVSARKPRDLVTVEHRLQPFSPEYYGADGRLFSYSAANAAACAVSAAGGGDAPPPFVRAIAGDAPTPVTSSAEPLAISLGDLIDCWVNPSRFWCRRVLRIRLRDEDEAGAEHEPVVVKGLTRYALEEEMVRRRIGHEPDLVRELALLGARGDLPSGALTAPHHRQLHATTRQFAGRVGIPRYVPPVGIRIEQGEWLIAGRVDGVTDEGYLQFRPAKVKPRDRIRVWITHVALCAELGDPGPARFVGVDHEVAWNVPDDPAAILDQFVAGYRAALLAPLPVFEHASYEYARRRRPNSLSPLAAAQKAFNITEDPVSGRRFGDLTDPSVRLCWRGRDPFEVALAAFECWSTAFWKPAFEFQVWT